MQTRAIERESSIQQDHTTVLIKNCNDQSGAITGGRGDHSAYN